MKVQVMAHEDDPRDYVREFVAYVNDAVPPGPSRADNIEMRMETLAADWARGLGFQAEFDDSTIFFNCTGLELKNGWGPRCGNHG